LAGAQSHGRRAWGPEKEEVTECQDHVGDEGQKMSLARADRGGGRGMFVTFRLGYVMRDAANEKRKRRGH